MLRHIAWLNETLIEPNPQGGLRSDDDRVRRRCLEPAAALENRGIACSVFGNLHDADPTEVSKLLQKLNTDIVVIGVFSDPVLIKLARAAKHLGCYLVADFADQTSINGDFQKLAELADCVVASSLTAQNLLQSGGFAAAIIPDVTPTNPANIAADAWLDFFKTLKMKPPVCANSNTPP